MVRSILGRTPFVFDWTDAPPDAGGIGATIVRFHLIVADANTNAKRFPMYVRCNDWLSRQAPASDYEVGHRGADSCSNNEIYNSNSFYC